jgi:hypothetical protein
VESRQKKRVLLGRPARITSKDRQNFGDETNSQEPDLTKSGGKQQSGCLVGRWLVGEDGVEAMRNIRF